MRDSRQQPGVAARPAAGGWRHTDAPSVRRRRPAAPAARNAAPRSGRENPGRGTQHRRGEQPGQQRMHLRASRKVLSQPATYWVIRPRAYSDSIAPRANMAADRCTVRERRARSQRFAQRGPLGHEMRQCRRTVPGGSLRGRAALADAQAAQQPRRRPSRSCGPGSTARPAGPGRPAGSSR